MRQWSVLVFKYSSFITYVCNTLPCPSSSLLHLCIYTVSWTDRRWNDQIVETLGATSRVSWLDHNMRHWDLLLRLSEENIREQKKTAAKAKGDDRVEKRSLCIYGFPIFTRSLSNRGALLCREHSSGHELRRWSDDSLRSPPEISEITQLWTRRRCPDLKLRARWHNVRASVDKSTGPRQVSSNGGSVIFRVGDYTVSVSKLEADCDPIGWPYYWDH